MGPMWAMMQQEKFEKMKYDSTFEWLTPASREFLLRDYLESGITPEQRIWQIAENAEVLLIDMWMKNWRAMKEPSEARNPFVGFADKFYGYMRRGFYSLSTPVWINFGSERGLPVSCFGSYIDDSVESILGKTAEIGTMTKNGGGCSAYYGALRSRGSLIKNGKNGQSGGPVSFMGLGDSVTNTISQGSARRGYLAAYLPVEHPDIEEFLQIRNEGHPIQEISIGVTITDKWMEQMIEEDPKGYRPKKDLWALIIKKRFETGFPYIMFIDNVNKRKPQVYKDKDYKIVASNMCAEICLPSTPEESFVCVLSSYNLERWEELEQTDAIETLAYFLDAVNEEFVRKSDGIKYLEAAHRFARDHKALGAGALGWNYLLQKNDIRFESWDAKALNNEIWKIISERSLKANMYLADQLGEAPILEGYGLRNTTNLAVAPTTSSGAILGTSQSIEIENALYYTKRLAKGNITIRNPYFEKVLEKYDKNIEEVWMDVLNHGGSCQHLDFLTDHEKEVFKTFGQTSQKEIVIQAAQRQKYIDQGQSLNLMVDSSASPKEVSQLLIFGWEQGIKCFYYQRGTNPAQELYRNLLHCDACS